MRSSLLLTDEPEREAVAARTHPCARLWPLGCIVSLVSVALLITAAAKPNVYKSTVDLAVGEASFDVGAYQVQKTHNIAPHHQYQTAEHVTQALVCRCVRCSCVTVPAR